MMCLMTLPSTHLPQRVFTTASEHASSSSTTIERPFKLPLGDTLALDDVNGQDGRLDIARLMGAIYNIE